MGYFMFNATIFMLGTIYFMGKYRLCIFYLLDSSDSLTPKCSLYPQILSQCLYSEKGLLLFKNKPSLIFVTVIYSMTIII